VLSGLILVIAATFSAMAAPAVVEAQNWPFAARARSQEPSLLPTTSAAQARSVESPFAAPAPSVSVIAATGQPPAVRTGTIPTAADRDFAAAIVEAASSLVSSVVPEASPVAIAPQAQPTAVASAAPIAQPAPIATAVPTPIATAVPTPIATPLPTPVATPVPVVSGPPAPLPGYSARAEGLFLAMNGERLAAGLSALVASEAATAIAMERALDMQQQGYFAHRSPSGTTWLTLVNAAAIPLTAGGENLAKISGDVERSVTIAITKLMESPTHAANILSGYFDSVGVAAVTDERGLTIFVAIFLG